MKVIQLVGDSKYGGATYLIIEWCKYLLAQGCEVDVLSTDAVTVRALNNIPKVKVIDDIYIPREINLRTDVQAFVKLWKLLLREKYDVVHTYTATPGVLGRIAAHISGTPAIFHHQAAWTVNEFSNFSERFFFTPLEFIATIASTRGICVSYAVAKDAEKFCLAPRRKLVIIPNGIDAHPFIHATDADILRHQLNLDVNTLVIGTTGRLASDKDFSTLLRAANILRNLMDRPFVFVFIGDGPDRSMLETVANELGVSDVIYFLGFRDDIPQLLLGIDIFLTTSLREGLSISIMEAMAAARPIVATSIPPNAELIENEKTGLLVDIRSPEQVVRAIERFAHEPDFAARCGSSAREKVLREYTLSRMFQQTWNLYNEFLIDYDE